MNTVARFRGISLLSFMLIRDIATLKGRAEHRCTHVLATLSGSPPGLSPPNQRCEMTSGADKPGKRRRRCGMHMMPAALPVESVDVYVSFAIRDESGDSSKQEANPNYSVHSRATDVLLASSATSDVLTLR
jgi:hypothetical protein